MLQRGEAARAFAAKASPKQKRACDAKREEQICHKGRVRRTRQRKHERYARKQHGAKHSNKHGQSLFHDLRFALPVKLRVQKVKPKPRKARKHSKCGR